MDLKRLAQILAEYRVLLIRDEINVQMQEIICTTIEVLDLKSHDPISLRIDCAGGSTTSSGLMIDAIRFAKSPVLGTVVGVAYSTAFTILQFCDRRLAYPNAKLMFHGVCPSRPPRSDEPLFDSYITNIKEQTENNARMIAKKSGQPIRKIREWSRQERVFTAKEALELNFIDEILTPPKKSSLK